jgi:choline dehydrogenase-like flavoprotein
MSYHASGTCKMGIAADPYAVVDEELKVRSVDHLRVAGTYLPKLKHLPSCFVVLTSGA